MTVDRMRAFCIHDTMRLEAGAALRAAYADTGYPRPPLDDVITRALATVAADTLYRADDQATCNKVDECTAQAVVFRHLAEWLSPGCTEAAP